MATVIFDFDSTLINCESLERIISDKHPNPAILAQIKEIGSQGMSGTIPFLTSLEKRLSLVSVSQRDVQTFGSRAKDFLTPGFQELIHTLKANRVDVWIVSGAPCEAMLPLVHELDIPRDHILGVELTWKPDGEFGGIDASKPINRSKWESAQQVYKRWSAPIIAIGDGMTDYELYRHKLVDYFIVFTQHARRQAVLDLSVPEARSTAELSQILRSLIGIGC